MAGSSEKKSLNFIEQIVEKDLKEGKNGGKVQTRFPPEPNGYLHIGHAKAICMDFGIAQKYGGVCNLRFDDTNPTKEDMEYVEAIKEDIRWLGFQWGHEYYASDYFQQLWDFAVRLIEEGKAGRPVCSFTIAGNFFELLKKIEAVGDEVKFGPSRGGMRFGAPCVYVSEMAAAGE